MSVLVDIEMRFGPGAPVDPLIPLKNVTYTEECEGYICDLIDIQIIPGKPTSIHSSFSLLLYSTGKNF